MFQRAFRALVVAVVFVTASTATIAAPLFDASGRNPDSSPGRMTLSPPAAPALRPPETQGDEQWEGGFNFPGLNGPVYALTVFHGLLVAGGHFDIAGPNGVSNIAFWNGSEWQPAGAGFDGFVFALTVFNDQLVAGGTFRESEGTLLSRVAVWNGTAWNPLGTGVNDAVRSFLVFDGKLVVGGDFTLAGGEPANRVATWDGAQWSTLGTGFTTSSYGVRALAVYADQLVAAGYFTAADGAPVGFIARWTGDRWTDLGRGADAPIEALATYHGELVAGGAFQAAGGKFSSAIARWDGATWNTLGSGFAAPFPLVQSLAVFGDELFAGGAFTSAGGTPAVGIARWNGDAWSPIGDVGAPIPDVPFVRALTVYGTRLVAGGEFLQAGGNFTPFVAQWDGSWDQIGVGLGLPGAGTALASRDGALFAAIQGSHTSWVARLNGDIWQPLGREFRGGYLLGLMPFESGLVAVGWFTNVGLEAVPHIAQWNGTRWSTLGAGFDALVEVVGMWRGELYAGGDFRRSGASPIQHLAVWNGGSWSEVGGGTNGAVWRLLEFDSKLVVGGHFTNVGANLAFNIAVWDGTIWSNLGDGFDDAVSALAVYNGELIAGGWFTGSGSKPLRRIARWNGQEWREMGSGFSGIVTQLYNFNGALFASGAFTEADGQPANFVARWDGTKWSALASGTDGQVAALQALDQRLYVGGWFGMAGGKLANGIARWNDTITPVAIEWANLAADGAGAHMAWRLSRDAIATAHSITVERSALQAGPYAVVAALEPNARLSYSDMTAEPGQDFWYRLALTTRDGVVARSSAEHLRVPFDAGAFLVVTPSRDGIHVQYGLADSGPMRLEVFDARGRRVRTLREGISVAGRAQLDWDRTGDGGIRVPTGVYWMRLRSAGASRVHKFVLTSR